MSRYIDVDKLIKFANNSKDKTIDANDIARFPIDDVQENVKAKKVIGGGERDGSTCWFECDNCGLAVDIGDVFCKHCGARFVP